jgi:hypothetical protein
MTFAEGMQHIVENIETSRENRISEIGKIRKETAYIQADARRAMTSLGAPRKRNAAIQHRNLRNCVKTNRKIVKAFLHDAHEARVESAQETQENLKDFVDTVKKDVANIRIDANNMVHGFAEDRLSDTIALSRMLKSYTDGITDDVHSMIYGFADDRKSMGAGLSRMLISYTEGITDNVEQLMGEFADQRSEVQAGLMDGHEVWQRYGQKGLGKTKTTGVVKAVRAEYERPKIEPEKERGDELQTKILKVIRHSPKGISLAEAGKKLDIEWRKLIGPAKHLMEEGMIRKKESHYFPVS